MAIHNLFEHRPEATKSSFRRTMTDRLYHQMLNERLGELRRRPGAPFVYAGSSTGDMTRQYEAAMMEVAAGQPPVELKPAFDELDRNAALIREALARDPDSRLLLEQLRRTYARRLALAQRVAYA